VICDFVQAFGFHLLDAASKSAFEELDRCLALVPVKSVQGDFILADGDDAELAGFLPLANAPSTPFAEMSRTSELEHRIHKVQCFVADLVHNDLKPLAAGGEILTTHAPGGKYDEDEEEEILIRPTFASTNAPSASVASPWGASTPSALHPALPTFYPFPSGGYGRTANWGGQGGNNHTNGASPDVDLYGWGWFTPQTASFPSANAGNQPRPSAPPGFQ
jgi:hypothetical protein